MEVQDSRGRDIKLDLTKLMDIDSQSRVFTLCVITRGIRKALIVFIDWLKHGTKGGLY